MLECDLTLEHIGIPVLRAAVSCAESHEDFVSRDLFAKILSNEEEHVDWLETQLGLVKHLGLQNFLQSQTSSS
jgi:bacterioferritin